MTQKTFVAGVGMVPFSKPSQSPMYDEMAVQATRVALDDAGLSYADVQQAFVGFVFGDTTSGQQALYQLGQTGIPIINVNNACASGSMALYLARQAIASGASEVALALGFEQMGRGALASALNDRTPVNGMINALMERTQGWDANAPQAAQYFGGAGREYQKKYGAKDETFARISVKARAHAARNPLALFRDPVSLEEVMASPHVFGPLTRLQCCPPTCGAAATILVSERVARKLGREKSVRIAGQGFSTDTVSSFAEDSMIKGIGYDMTKVAANLAYQEAGIDPGEASVVELHDCFTVNELISYEALGLTPEGTAERFVIDGDNSFGGKIVTNPSGGLLSKGHPLGATGLAQIAELTWQLRGQAGERQVEGARIAIQHNIGMGGACVVSVLTRE
jgi:sterol carrier protein 2